MEKITKPSISDIPTLIELSNNYIQWGKDFAEKLGKGGKSSAFTWKGGLYNEMRHQLCLITKEHCTFCDAFPVAHISKETIEHYFPKGEYPLKSYDWDNLFYCCDKCQSEANKINFIETLKPDTSTYTFSDYFYFDLGSGELKVLENLKMTNPTAFENATAFLIRYGISNNPKRNRARITLFKEIQNHFAAKSITDDIRKRDDFMYRYVYDYYVNLNGENI
jgi:uncharacterized protein (TIGR02646 family)